ncbi:MAG: alpha/beta hydrolase [Dokdonella sp.]
MNMNSFPTIPATELRIELRHITLAAKAWGNPANPPMLVLHGWLDNAGSFDRLAPLLGSHYVVALDLAGHGSSDWRPAGSWYAYIDYLDDIAEVLDHFGWSCIDLLGHSLGGTLASVFAAAFPERVQRMILIEALGPLTAPAERSLAQLRSGLQARRTAHEKSLRVFPSLEAAIDIRRKASGLSDIAAHCIVARGTEPVDAPEERPAKSGSAVSVEIETSGFRWSSDPRLTLPSVQRFTEAQILSVLSGIEAKTLMILAEPATSYLPSEIMDARAAAVTDIVTRRLPGTHHLHLEDPLPVAYAINAFLGDV